MKIKRLKKLLKSPETLVVPDAYDPISAKLIENAGFKAVQCSGYSFSISAGYNNEIDLTLDENLELTRKIVEAVDIPVMADAEDGYGGLDDVIKTVKKFINTGAAGLNIEDQIPDRKPRVSVVDADLMINKIRVAKETTENEAKSDFIINGRTDALRTTEDRSSGLEIAIDRANQYLEAGADLAFITYVATLDEVDKIMKEVKGPVSIAAGQTYNINEFSIGDLQRYGVKRVSLPTLLLFSGLYGINQSLKYLREDNLSKMMEENLFYPLDNLNKIL
jgi:2-methylisocitrate lyase-like PEP mutase family enzyme